MCRLHVHLLVTVQEVQYYVHCTLDFFMNFVVYLLVFTFILLTESDILALATRVQKSLKDDVASAGVNNVTIIIAIHFCSPLFTS